MLNEVIKVLKEWKGILPFELSEETTLDIARSVTNVVCTDLIISKISGKPYSIDRVDLPLL